VVKTYGLTHIALAVEDADRSFAFYRDVFGMILVYRENGFVQAQTPGCRDVRCRPRRVRAPRMD
jgi:catechol 2,3-dioxygenase-like lactoylglutathione lyase family enzyme